MRGTHPDAITINKNAGNPIWRISRTAGLSSGEMTLPSMVSSAIRKERAASHPDEGRTGPMATSAAPCASGEPRGSQITSATAAG